MEETLLKFKIAREVRERLSLLLDGVELERVTDGRGLYIPFGPKLQEELRCHLGAVAGGAASSEI